MKTDVLPAPNGVTIDAAISLDGFIVKETLAKDALLPKTARPVKERVFTAADLWNIQKNGKRH
jgi:hypothetical protein